MSNVINLKKSVTHSKTRFLKVAELERPCFIVKGEDPVYLGDQRLPYVYADCREALDLMGLPCKESYRKGKKVFEYWDPKEASMDTVTLPLYCYNPFQKAYSYSGEHTGKIPSVWMWEKAEALKEDVTASIKALKKAEYAKEILNGHVIGIALTEHVIRDIDWNGMKIKAFSYAIDDTHRIQVLFDEGKILENEWTTLIISIPEELKNYYDFIISKSYHNIIAWGQNIGLENVYVK